MKIINLKGISFDLEILNGIGIERKHKDWGGGSQIWPNPFIILGVSKIDFAPNASELSDEFWDEFDKVAKLFSDKPNQRAPVKTF